MGSGKPGRRHQRKTSAGRPSSSPALSENAVTDLPIGAELYEKHRLELENLTLATQPLKTLKLSSLAAVQYTKSVLYAFTKHGWFMILGTLIMACGVLFVAVQGPHNKHVRELFCYIRFVLWWTALGVASSIGLGSGLHTFVLYLGPHIALFTIKAMNCGRVDLKTALYDTIQLKSGPSWLDKDCSEFGPPLFFSSPNSLVKVPLSSILPQVQFEAILWGFGTAIGELPPYFISKAAHMSGSKLDAVEELEFSPKQTGIISGRLKEIKCWLFSHSQHLNFFTVLVLASVPNPLFDLAGIMCGQFGIPFWKFFFATLIGKAIIKTHIQTIFIISVCNNQLLEWIESELIWVFSLFPGLSSYLANVIAKLHKMREKFVSPVPVRTNMKGKQWGISFSGIWNAVIWLMLMNFFVKIVNATAQKQLNQQRERVVKKAERLKTIQRS